MGWIQFLCSNMASYKVPTTAGSVMRTDYSLGLKVMRLKSPEVFIPTDPGVEPDDCLFGLNFFFHRMGYFNNVLAGLDFGLSKSRALLVPKDFGQIYVGETFRSYISVHNHASTVVRVCNLHIWVLDCLFPLPL